MVQIVRIFEGLPEAVEALTDEARAEGFHHIGAMALDWASGAMRYDREGEALFAAFVDGELAAVGGVTLEEMDPALSHARRMRRLYVRPAHRRRGVGRTLAGAMIQQGFACASVLTVNAGTPDAPAFWEALGFESDARAGHTHVLRTA